MKKIQLAASSLLIAAVIHAPAFAGNGKSEETAAFPAAELVPLIDLRSIKVGMTPNEVLASMRGKPDETMTPQIWIYWEFKGLKRPADMKQPATIVFFSDDRVNLIRYSEATLVRKTLAELRAAAGASLPTAMATRTEPLLRTRVKSR